MEFLDTYVDLCRTLGPLVDWVQGAGGNISFKNATQLLIKASGFALGATTRSEGWVCCDIQKVLALFEDGNEDFTGVVVEGAGKPSIETFLHCLPKKIVVHLHPMNFLPYLCATNKKADDYPIVPYIKPGLQLGKALFDVYDPALNVYWLANHGVVIAADTTTEIFDSLNILQSKIPPSVPKSDPLFVYRLRQALVHQDLLIRPILQAHPSTFHSRVFLPYTPDIVVFLQQAPLFYDELVSNPEEALAKYQETYKVNPTIIYTPSMIYSVAPTLSKCVAIEEIFCAYLRIPPTDTLFLDAHQVDELVNWDKEKERKHAK